MKGKQKNNKNIIYIMFPILVIVSIIGFIFILRQSDNKKLDEKYNNEVNYDKEIMLGDIQINSSAINYDNSNSGLTSTKVQAAIDELNTEANNQMIPYRDQICPGCVYRKSTTEKYNSGASGADGTNNVLSLSEYTTDYTTLNSNCFLGHVIDGSGYILASYACGINNGTFFCFRGVDSDQSSLTYKPFYQEGVNRMNKAFPGCNATTSSFFAYCIGGVIARVYSSGRAHATMGDCLCNVYSDGNSYCS